MVAIDHYELFYLGALLDEIFGRENRIGVISVAHNPGGRQDDAFFPTAHENMLFYAKDISRPKLNRLDMSKKKISQYRLRDSFGRYKLRGFRRSGSNSKRDQRPKLFYPIYFNPVNRHIDFEQHLHYEEILPIDEKGVERCWRWGPETLRKRIDKYIEVKRKGKRYDIYIKEREDDYRGEKPKTLWLDSKYSGQTATNELKKLFGDKVFSYPKSPFLIKDVVKICTKKRDIVLDFFAGSATTAAVAHKMNRQWIAVEQMDYVEDLTVERLKKVVGKEVKPEGKLLEEIEYDTGDISESVDWRGGGDFIFCELMQYNEAFMEKIQAAQSSEELVVLWGDIAENSFLNWYVNPEMPEDAVSDFIAIGKTGNGLDKQKKLLAELLNKNQLYINLSEIEDEAFAVREEDKALNRAFYGDF